MSSLQQRIVTQAVARMKLINGTGGYTNNVASRVKDSETNWAEDQSNLPAISIFDGDAVVAMADPDHRSRVIVTQPLLIKGFIKQGTDASAARSLIVDIYTAIRVDTQWSENASTPLAMQTRMVRHAIVRNPENFEVEACEVEVELQYKVTKFTA